MAVQIWDGGTSLHYADGADLQSASAHTEPNPFTVVVNSPVTYGVGISLQFQNVVDQDQTILFAGAGASFHFDY